MRLFATPRFRFFFHVLAWVLLGALCARAGLIRAEEVPVGQRMGALHGFLSLRDGNGKVIAVGDQVDVAEGNNIRARLTFHFRDGSLDDEEAVFRQGRTFELIWDHHVQKGPSFPKPLDLTIEVPKGEVTWRESSGKGSKTKHKHMTLPSDLVNGMVSLAVQNFPAKAGEIKVSYLVIDSGPRVVQFAITRDGADKVLLGDESRRAERYNVHIEIGGEAGVVASLFGKQPPDFKMWAVDGAVPVFLRMTGALYEGGPAWTMTLAAPEWPEEKR